MEIQLLKDPEQFSSEEVLEHTLGAVRKNIIQNLDESISILSDWTASEDENIRRFASEATRPRGVWCEHIKELKENPTSALPILEPLKSDPSRYVQNSAGNWLNDAGKTQPGFVRELCKRWLKESDTKETKYIVKRTLRTIDKSI
jgi:3-methyladenine DNA glycosylase AlkC